MKNLCIKDLIKEIQNNPEIMSGKNNRILAKICIGGNVFLITGIKSPDTPNLLNGYFQNAGDKVQGYIDLDEIASMNMFGKLISCEFVLIPFV